MPDLLTRDLAKALGGDPAGNALCLRVALAEVHCVGIVCFRLTNLNELLHAQDGGSVEAVELRLDVGAYGGMEGLDGLRGEDFAVKRECRRGRR